MNKRFVLGICILIFIIFLGIGIPKRVEGYVCDEGWYCDDSGTLGAGDWIKLYPWRCMKVENWWDFDCWGSDSDCHGESPVFYYSEPNCLNDIDPHQLGCCSPGSPPSPPCTPATSCSCSPLSDTETSYGSKTVECDDGCGGTASSTCWCTGNCTPQSCPTGTTETDTGDYYNTYSCTNECAVTQDRNCYCKICTPPLSCSSAGYNDTNLGYGQVPPDKTPSCRNGQGASDNQTKCDMTYRTCYCYSCLKDCPSPLANTGNTSLILNDFRECTNDCSVKPPENQDDCYELPSNQPTEILEVINTGAKNHYGFNSGTHTGDRLKDINKLGTLNDPFNPPITMKATYKDDDGAGDIEGLFVWFRGSQYTGELGTPLYISETATPKASANDSWGFMLRRSGNDWNPYVPSYQSESVFWTRALLNSTDKYKAFWIAGPNGQNMIEVTIIESPEEDSIEKKVSIEFSLRFSDNNGNLFPDNVSEGLYKIYLMGLDKFSFTPYDNYDINYENFWSKGFLYDDPNKTEDFSPFWKPNQLRYKAEQGQTYARDWGEPLQTWTIDRTSPTLNTDISVSGNSITLGWNASDDRNLYAIVGNISAVDGGVEITGLSSSGGNVSLHNTPFVPGSVTDDEIGKLNKLSTTTTLFQVGPNINGKEHEGSVTLNINHDAQNFLDFYITVFDDAGNIVQSNQIRQDLNDWMVTSGGLAYSNGGTSFTVKDLDGVIWSGTLPPSNYEGNPGLIPPNVNLTSEVWGENSDYPISFVPRSPLNSYSLSRFTGIKLEKDNYYTLLRDSYEKNKKNLEDKVLEMGILGSLSGAVTNYCSDAEYCVFESIDGVDSISIDSNFVCNKKTLMFINGNLTINPPLKNATDIDTLSKINGCIFVVSGNVSIGRGVNASTGSIGYDKVNGYILADGQIIIKDETNKRVPNTDPIIDGVYINGGLQSLGSNKSIVFNRYLRLQDRVKFPLLAIDLHPKYGILGEKFFGSKYIIQIIELGVKP